MTDITMIVDTLERIGRLRRGLVAKKRTVAEAEAAVENAGWNKSAALRKVREAEEALAAQVAEVGELEDTLPPMRDDGTRWLFTRVAEVRIERGDLEKRLGAAETTLEEALAEAAKDSWKWKSRAAAGAAAEPKAVTAAREALAALKKEISVHGDQNKEIAAMFDAHVTAAQEAAEVAAWAAGGYEGERPECIQRAEREFAEEMAEGCERIALPRKLPYIAVTTCAPLVEEYLDPDLDPAVEWGTPLSVEAYLNQLVPPPPPKEEFVSSSTGRTPAWIKRMLEGRKAARARQAAVAVQ